jgi:SAM-dependent MidA family methyltransferase
MAQPIPVDLPTYRDFVDDALFHPRWGYYSTGQVRFGDGGHYDTFPIALSPHFGRMVARLAYRTWCRLGKPRRFEICELSAGNGQLCQDTLLAIDLAPRRGDWLRFWRLCRYRIVERSPALIARQRQALGPLAERVDWLEADLAQAPARAAGMAQCGMIVANEVLDCLAHQKVVAAVDGTARFALVAARQVAKGGALTRAQLNNAMASLQRQDVHFEEILRPIAAMPDVETFVRRHYPEFVAPRRGKPVSYFACPAYAELMRNTARLYRRADAIWIDYGDLRDFHLRASAKLKEFAGPPRSGASVYDDPGRDDITFMVDFSAVAEEAEAAGWRVVTYGSQRELARRSGVRLDDKAAAEILQYRMIRWMLSVVGLGAEKEWRQSSLTWNKRAARGGRVRDDVRRTIDEFLGRRQSFFRVIILRRD